MTSITWPWKQLKGALSNFVSYIRGFHFDDVLPPGFKDLINWTFGMVPKAIGLRGATPREQINANVVLILLMVVIGIPTIGASLVFLLLWVPLLFVGILRWIPIVDRGWTKFVSFLPVKDDYDIPGWRSE